MPVQTRASRVGPLDFRLVRGVVGWVARSDTHQCQRSWAMGFAALYVARWSAHPGGTGAIAGFAWEAARPACRTPEPGASSSDKNTSGGALP